MVAYLISIAAGITLTLLGKPGWLVISGLFQILFSDFPRVSGTWTAIFFEPTETGTVEEVSEGIKIHQLGRIVWGEGGANNDRNRIFKYRGSILRNTMNGSYRVKKKNSPAGTGSFQLRITGDDASMKGWCIWYDRNTEEVEASSYKWNKNA